jgi:small subunit ribosomal protein S21
VAEIEATDDSDFESQEEVESNEHGGYREGGEERGSSRREGGYDSGGGGQSRKSRALAVFVDDRGLESALRTFKKLVAKEGLLKDLKRRQHYEKPGERRRRKQREAMRRRRRQEARSRATGR